MRRGMDYYRQEHVAAQIRRAAMKYKPAGERNIRLLDEDDEYEEKRRQYMREYMNRPGVREKRRAYAKKYYAKKKRQAAKNA